MGIVSKILSVYAPISLVFGSSSTWIGTTDDWGVASNWNPADIPSNSGDVAIFASATIANQPNLNGVGYTLGSITFQSTSPTITIDPTIGADTITLNGGSTNSLLTVANNSDTINANLNLTSLTSTSVASGATLTLAGVISGSNAFTIGGTGTTALTNAGNSYSGGLTIAAGILRASSAGALGGVGQIITMTTGTLQAGGANLSLSATQTFPITGVATFDTNGFVITIPGVISSTGSVTQTGSGTLTLTGINTYQGGTSVTGASGTLNISADNNLGESTSALSLGDHTTLQAGAAFTLNEARTVTLQGIVTIDTQSFQSSILGPLQGANGALIVQGSGGGSLTLSGQNTYAAGTTVATGTLEGTTTSLQGAINMSGTSTVIFNQATSGTYAGQIIGVAGTTLTFQGGGVYTLSGNSSTSLSTTQITGSSTLNLTGHLGSTTTTIGAGSALQGIGTLSGAVTSTGQIIPGNAGAGTLTISGNTTLTSGAGILVSQLTPTTNGLLQVNGTATLTNSILQIEPDFSQFFGLSQSYTLLSGTSIVGTFQTPISPNPNFELALTYTATDVLLELTVLRPFSQFSCGNYNECAVANNLDSLNVAGDLTTGLSFVINALVSQDQSVVQDALDQMHPAALSAFAELQAELGGQFLSISHRKPTTFCHCNQPSRIWVEPFINWLHEKSQGMEIGFRGKTWGIAAGFDSNLTPWFVLGFSGAYNTTDLKWSLDRGYGYVDGAQAALYGDFTFDRFYMGFSGYVGRDWYRVARHIQFTTINEQATSHTDGLEAGAQWTLAYYFGKPVFLLYPYLTADYLYLHNDAFQERGAGALNLTVDSYTSQTLRTQTGITWEFTDRNLAKTFCISPLFSIGYIMQWPISRSQYTATFQQETLSFRTRGWTELWQLWNFRFDLRLTYLCFNLDSEYSIDISPEGASPFVNQRANFKMSYGF